MGSQRRRAAIAAILALALWGSAFAQAPEVTASWTAPHTARIEWSGGSLWRIADGVETWIAGPSPQTLSAGADSAYVPKAGDRYEVRSTISGEVLAVAFLGPEPLWHRVTLVLVVK